MKRLFYISLALVLITTVGCKRKNRAERLYERYLNDSNRGSGGRTCCRRNRRSLLYT